MRDEKNSGKSIDRVDFLNFLVTTVIDITRKMTGLELLPSQDISLGAASGVASFSTRTSGDFRVSLGMSAHIELLKEITRRMKSQTEVSMGDVEMYGSEYFNIIFGMLLSHVNNTMHTRTCFHVPLFSESLYPVRSLDDRYWHVRALTCSYGTMEVGFCEPAETESLIESRIV